MSRFRISNNADFLELDLEFTWTYLKATLIIHPPNHRKPLYTWDGGYSQNENGFVITVIDTAVADFFEFCIVGISEQEMQKLSKFISKYMPYENTNDSGSYLPPT